MPEGWEWSRIGSLFNTVTGSTPSTKNNEYYSDAYPFYKPTDLDNGYDVYDSSDHVSEAGYNAGRPLPEHSVLVTCIGATIGKTGLIHNTGICNQQINALLPSSYISSDYTFYSMCSEFEQTQIISNASATTLPILNKSRFDTLLFVVPPFQQQIKISNEIKNMLDLISVLEENKDSLQDIISDTKSKILDMAIKGKLVPQDPNDEPASALLERIRAEKEELIKQGKLKRDKKESIIYKGDDNSYYEKLNDENSVNINKELPYEIPETWGWSRLSSLCSKEIKRGKTPKYIESSNTLVFAQKCNIKKGGIDYTLAQFLDESTLSKYDDSEFIRCGDTVINSTGTGTLGRVGFIESLSRCNIVPDSHVTTIRVIAEMDPFYIFVLLKSLQPTLEKKGEGSTNQKELKPNTLQNIFVPIPPIEEQKRICKAVQSCHTLLKNIEDSII